MRRGAAHCVEDALWSPGVRCHFGVMTTLKQSHHFYLTDDLTAALESLVRKSGSSKSAIVAEALRWSFEKGEPSPPDRSIAARIDRTARVSERLSRRLDEISETLGVFIQHQLTMVAQPSFTPEATHLGQLRYREFIDTVGRNLARSERAAFACAGPVPGTLEGENADEGRDAQGNDDNARPE